MRGALQRRALTAPILTATGPTNAAVSASSPISSVAVQRSILTLDVRRKIKTNLGLKSGWKTSLMNSESACVFLLFFYSHTNASRKDVGVPRIQSEPV